MEKYSEQSFKEKSHVSYLGEVWEFNILYA